jgi:hypothetical protein
MTRSTVATSRRRVLRAALALPALLLAMSAACMDDGVTPRPQPTFTRMMLTFTPNGGGPPQNIEITRATGTVSGPLTVPATGGNLTARYLNVDGTDDLVIETYQIEYETRVELTEGSAVTFTRTGLNAYAVTRAQGQSGTGTARVRLWDQGTRTARLEANVAVSAP